MIIITSKKDGFRRCGVAHPMAPTMYEDGSFTPDQINELQAEPMLTVQFDDAESKKGKKPEKSEDN